MLIYTSKSEVYANIQLKYHNRNPIAITRAPKFMDGVVIMALFFEEALVVVPEELADETPEEVDEVVEMASEADVVEEPPTVLLDSTVISKTPDDMSLLSKFDDEV